MFSFLLTRVVFKSCIALVTIDVKHADSTKILNKPMATSFSIHATRMVSVA